jgi:hypothetical protein
MSPRTRPSNKALKPTRSASESVRGPRGLTLCWADNGRAMEAGTTAIRCIGCGGLVPQMDGPTHRYMESSPGCWHLYGEVLAREYGDRAFAAVHRLTVDAYAVQHPGRPSPQAIQSVCVHLLSLCLVLERGLAANYATRVMGEATRAKGRFFWLTPPALLGRVTVADVAAAAAPHEHEERVRAWAEAAWSAWAEHHATVRSWVPA